MLTLSLLPGPDEVKLHKINYFLLLIVNKLLEFQNEVYLPITNNYPTGRNIRIVVICYNNDISASRKLCNHASALVGCHQCHKRASSENGQKLNFEGFNDMTNWFKVKDPIEYRCNILI